MTFLVRQSKSVITVKAKIYLQRIRYRKQPAQSRPTGSLGSRCDNLDARCHIHQPDHPACRKGKDRSENENRGSILTLARYDFMNIVFLKNSVIAERS